MTEAGPVDFKDKGCEEVPVVECERYSLVAALPDHNLWVVYLGYYEGGSYILVDIKTGKVTDVGGFPLFSPDGRRFITVSNEPYDLPILAIWKLQQKEIAKEWGYDFATDRPEGEWSYCVERWAGNNRVILEGRGNLVIDKGPGVVGADRFRSIFLTGRTSLRFDGATWHYRQPLRLKREAG
ncbi:hypothetical protein [Microvirga brassicacearum]|uniref:Uncharacterized protein n=1 Tax=Microvirga brassicacearum TaxID=2580413 RepID=A0A5N3P7W7_9HYPH|nr:hypothetical protein [Microvirga brassicacearum]KAB0265839.1 hypothetical protein FEZ63_16500 [Microvirga brassicacearum]